jgi:hypothetical protein
MTKSRPGSARGVSSADVSHGSSSRSSRDVTAALLKAYGRWCSPRPTDGDCSSRLSPATWLMAEASER